MLPKFRPATLGLPASVRPSIRPVKASPPPPAPSPPRRRESGFGPRADFAQESRAAIETERFEEIPTATGRSGDRSTLDLGPGPATLPRETARELPPDTVQASPRGGRGNVMHLAFDAFDDETQARAIDDQVLDKLRRETAAARQPKADLAVDYESLPSLEIRRPYDTFEEAFSERDPVTQARESARVRRADARDGGSYNREPSYDREASYREPEVEQQDVEQQEEEFWGRRGGSGSRPVQSAAQSYAAPVPSYDDESRPWGDPPPPAATGLSSMPPAQGYPTHEQPPPASPRAPGFVVGVQPIRTATPDAWGTPHPMAGAYLPSPMQGAMPGYGVAANEPQYAPQMPYPQQQQAYQSQQPQGYAPMVVAAGSTPPVAAQLATPQPAAAANVGRFAWFVAGAAFGITFAFFATGFFNGGRLAKDDVPPAAPVAAIAQTAAPVAAPVAPVMAQPQVQEPTAGSLPPTIPSNLPNAPATSQPKSGSTATAPRFVAPRPPRSPRSSGRRPAPASTRSAETEAPAPSAPAPSAPASGGGDLGDLLGAGLNP